jgi:hypothetical protein
MRACARLDFRLLVVFAGLGLAGCSAIDELKDKMSEWFGTETSVVRHEVSPGDLPGVADKIPAEKMLTKKMSKASKKTDKPASPPQRLQKAEIPKKPSVSDSADAVSPQRRDDGSASSQAAPLRLRTPWPEAPASGAFSR